MNENLWKYSRECKIWMHFDSCNYVYTMFVEQFLLIEVECNKNAQKVFIIDDEGKKTHTHKQKLLEE